MYEKETIPELIPKYLEVCPICEGTGIHDYNNCTWCSHSTSYISGLGYKMKDGSEVPISVINQIEIAHDKYLTLQNLLIPK